MARTARRRSNPAPQLEALEARALLAGDPAGVRALPVPDPARQLVVRFADSVPEVRVRAIVLAAGGQVRHALPDGPILVGLDPGVRSDVALARLRRDPVVRYAELDAPFRSAEVFSNDPNLAQEWGLNNPGTNIDIDAPRAWDVTTGAGAIVAVLDTGIDTAHPDLADNLWVNPREIAGNDFDDDGNGLADDVHGWNFLAGTADIQDDNGHGSHVSGILAAEGDNGLGTVGVAWNARILPLKVLDALGNGTSYAVVAAIHYAVEHGARIINASWGGASYSAAMAEAIQYAGDHGVVVVVAAGNEAVNNAVVRSYPADYRFPNVISVAAIDINGALAGFSNFGRRAVDLAAPGVGILSTIPGGQYASYSGTSMATPHVSGVVALLVAQHPEFSSAQLVRRILETTKPLAGRATLTATRGLVNAAGALGLAVAPAIGRRGAVQRIFAPRVVRARRRALRSVAAIPDGTPRAAAPQLRGAGAGGLEFFSGQGPSRAV